MHACSPVLFVSLRQLLLQVLEPKTVTTGVEAEAAGAYDGGRRRTRLEQVAPLTNGAQDRVVLPDKVLFL